MPQDESHGRSSWLLVGNRGEAELVEAATADMSDLMTGFKLLPGHERQYVSACRCFVRDGRKECNVVGRRAADAV